MKAKALLGSRQQSDTGGVFGFDRAGPIWPSRPENRAWDLGQDPAAERWTEGKLGLG
jgi:hypothetical protein